MKHQTPESMKFRKLQRRLGTSKKDIVGTLELLWISVQKNTPQGDIGKFSNEEIAIECEWEGDPDELVDALVDTGWLDPCDTHRLVVHDWEEHCPGWIKRQLKRHNKCIYKPTKCHDGTASSLLSVTDDSLEATPNLTQPNPTKKENDPPPEIPEQPNQQFQLDEPPPLHSPKVQDAWDHWLKVIYHAGQPINEPALFVTRGKLLDYSEAEAIAYLTHWAAQRRYTEDFRGKGHLVHMPSEKPPQPKQTGPPSPKREFGPRKKATKKRLVKVDDD